MIQDVSNCFIGGSPSSANKTMGPAVEMATYRKIGRFVHLQQLTVILYDDGPELGELSDDLTTLLIDGAHQLITLVG
jgi:hypothetical protein